MISKFKGKKIVVLTGAGISAESGLRTFRDADGLWEGHRVDDVATPEAFEENPDLVHRFYNERRKQLKTVKPNAAHIALADFEKAHDGEFLLVTQNVDDLHERAGSKNIIHMHGELNKVRCLDTGEIFEWEGETGLKTPHPKPGFPDGRLRPHICWFGEIPYFMYEISKAVGKADIFVAIGTSGVVYPAAGFVAETKHNCRRVLINKDSATNNSLFKEVIMGAATEKVPQFFSS